MTQNKAKSHRRKVSGKRKADEIEAQSDQGSVISYDVNLLACSRIQWQFGDWDSLVKIKINTLQNHPDRAELALLVAAGHLQTESLDKAKTFIRLAKDWACSKELLFRILVSGVHNSIGRAAAIAGMRDQALQHLNNAIKTVIPNGDLNLLSQARANHEFSKLGLLPPIIKKSIDDEYLSQYGAALIEPEDIISQALRLLPDDPSLLIASAEIAMRNGLQDEAIRRWQRLVAVEGELMPETYYDRLAKAYKDQKSFPLGSPEEESLRGDGDKHELLAKIHNTINPENYLEIGVQTGKSLALANCKAIGVDPMPLISVKLGDNVQVVSTTSDHFFYGEANRLIDNPLDFVFIDGMHLFEYALRDFINVEKLSSQHTLVVIDDIYPGHPAQAERIRRTRAWTGDVWKLLEVIKQYRPDLQLLTLDAYPTGLLLITGLNSSNTILQDAYKEITDMFKGINLLPDDILKRTNAYSCKSDKLIKFLNELNSSKKRSLMQRA